MEKKKLSKKIWLVIASVSLALLCAFAIPFCINAFSVSDLSEGKIHSVDEPLFVADMDSGNGWVTEDGVWHSCVYESTNEFLRVTDDFRKAMINRESSHTTYFAIKKSSGIDYKNVLNKINDHIYDDCDSPYGGDYLKLLSRIKFEEFNQYTDYRTVDINSPDCEYDFYKLTLNIESKTTKQEEKAVDEFLTAFNQKYILNNEKIQLSSFDDKQYYTLKTIYNFVTKNTEYDFEVYDASKGVSNGISQSSKRFVRAHTAFGALFGNVENINTSDNFDMIKGLDLGLQQDSQGLYRIHEMNNGKAVCDGYSLVVYALCKMNGIDCRIVEGDYTTQDKKGDPHAWNIVNVKDYDDSQYYWYYVDATFGGQRSKKMSKDIVVTDYSYFLRGTDSEYFSASNHQQMYSSYNIEGQSQNDFQFEIIDIDSSRLNTIVTRRRTEEDGTDIGITSETLENYMVIAPDGKYYKFDHSNNNSLKISDGFIYYGSGYYYSCEFYDFARGIEYTCEDQFIVNAGKYDFDIHTSKGELFYTKTVTILPLDLSNAENYDSELTRYPGHANFNGGDIEIYADIYDNSKRKLDPDVDYTLTCYKKSDTEATTPVKPHEPGKYFVRINYFGNYTGYFDVDVDIYKANLEQLKPPADKDIPYGSDIESGYSKLKIGDTDIFLNKDYKLTVSGGLEAGNTGTITITGLAGSKYIQENTFTKWTYKIVPRAIASLFNGKYISTVKYAYTGKEIKPTNFKLMLESNTGEVTTLVRNVDYVIKSYSNNINIGTGIINIEFIGNYSGTAKMKFYIESGAGSITCADLTYNGKTLYPNPVVKAGSVVLKKGTDYTVSGSGKTPGAYIGKVTGKGKFANVSSSFVYYIKPAVPSGVKTSSTTNKFSISWTKQGSNCVYEIYVYDTGKKTWTRIGYTTSSSIVVSAVYVNGKKTAVKPNTTYKIRIRAYVKGTVNGKAFTKTGSYKEFSERTTPTSIKGGKITVARNYIKLSWTKQSGCSYQIYVYDTGKKNWRLITTTSNGSYKISSVYTKGRKVAVKPNTAYKIRIRAISTTTLNGKRVTKYGQISELSARTKR